ncbi:MAG: Wzt carbohydrate-binding domain-containing protein [Bacteroidota bacterium]
MQDGYILFIIEDFKGNMAFASANDDQGDSVIGTLEVGEHSFIAKIPEKILAPGTYYITLSLKPKIGKPHHKIENALSFEVIDTKTYRGMKNLYRPLSIAPEIDWRLILD